MAIRISKLGLFLLWGLAQGLVLIGTVLVHHCTISELAQQATYIVAVTNNTGNVRRTASLLRIHMPPFSNSTVTGCKLILSKCYCLRK